MKIRLLCNNALQHDARIPHMYHLTGLFVHDVMHASQDHDKFPSQEETISWIE